MNHWDQRGLALAEFVADWSKDPSTKVGAVIMRPNHSIASIGFNGLPIGVKDTEERLGHRPTKYRMTVHAERNALAFAVESLIGYTIYTWPFAPCPQCAGDIIQRGIRRAVAPPLPERLRERWEEDITYTMAMFKEAGVVLYLPAEAAVRE